MRVLSILMGILILISIGCMKNQEEVRYVNLKSRIDSCVLSIMSVCRCDKYEDDLRKIIGELKYETNVTVRDGLADHLSEQVLLVDLTLDGCGYGDLEIRIDRYIQCAGAVATLLHETKGDCRWLDFFVKSASKLKQACFSVSWESRRKDETLVDYRCRKSTALNLYNAYAQEVALWKCYKGTGEKSLLSSELREEFILRTESLFDYPKRNELLKCFTK